MPNNNNWGMKLLTNCIFWAFRAFIFLLPVFAVVFLIGIPILVVFLIINGNYRGAVAVGIVFFVGAAAILFKADFSKFIL